jgi:hypothetical protein
VQAKTFSKLRRKVHVQCFIDLGKRLLKHGVLKPTIQEISLGTFLEDIEMQVRDAVLEMNRKGYCTWSSGFYGQKNDVQGIDGPFVLDKQVIAKLEKAGATVETEKFWGRNYTSITFCSTIPDTRLIIRDWMKLVALIPSRRCKAILSETYGAFIFRHQYASSYKQIERLRLQRLIEARQNPRWMKRWKRRLRRLGK